MIQIVLTGRLHQGLTVIDDIDSDLAALRWRVQRATRSQLMYAVSGSAHSARVLMHRLVLERVLERPLGPNELVDHINGDGLDNRRSNLRVATHGQNMANRQPSQTGRSRFLGVYRDARHGPRCWRAELRSKGKKYCLGYHDTEEAAALAYNEAAARIHGQFARLNQVARVELCIAGQER